MAGPLGSAPSIILAAGLGAAASTALEPVVEPARQKAWSNNQFRISDPATYAALVAQGGIELHAGELLAHRHGFADDKFKALVYLAQRAPTYGEAQDLRRRGKISAEQLRHAFAKAQIEAQYWDALADLVDERLSPQVMALAVVRGLVKDPGILPVGPPTEVGKVPAFPVFNINPVTESAASGIDLERLSILAGIAGRPMGPESAAAAYFRGILELADYDRAISEGDVRNEWAASILETARQIPSVSDYVNLHIRGWITVAQMHAGAARHGMSAADVDQLYLRTGRPATAHQVFIGLRRGGARNGPVGDVPDDIQASVKQSDIRPEWTNPIWHGLETYPSGFMVRGAVQNGDLAPADAKQLLYEVGWKQKWIDVFVDSWAGKGGAAATSDPREKLAVSQAIASLKRQFLLERVDDAAVLSGLELLGVTAASAGRILETWTVERGWTEKPLTPSQIKKAFKASVYTQDEAVVMLEMQHYTEADAITYLTT